MSSNEQEKLKKSSVAPRKVATSAEAAQTKANILKNNTSLCEGKHKIADAVVSEIVQSKTVASSMNKTVPAKTVLQNKKENTLANTPAKRKASVISISQDKTDEPTVTKQIESKTAIAPIKKIDPAKNVLEEKKENTPTTKNVSEIKIEAASPNSNENKSTTRARARTRNRNRRRRFKRFFRKKAVKGKCAISSNLPKIENMATSNQAKKVDAKKSTQAVPLPTAARQVSNLSKSQRLHAKRRKNKMIALYKAKEKETKKIERNRPQLGIKYMIVDKNLQGDEIPVLKRNLLEEAFTAGLADMIISSDSNYPVCQILDSRFEKSIFTITLPNNNDECLLRRMVETMPAPWPGARLRLRERTDCISAVQLYKVKVFIRGRASRYSTSKIIDMIGKQNPNLQVDLWNLYHRSYASDGCLLLLGIDKLSYNQLESSNGQAYLLSTNIIFKDSKRALGERFNPKVSDTRINGQSNHWPDMSDVQPLKNSEPDSGINNLADNDNNGSLNNQQLLWLVRAISMTMANGMYNDSSALSTREKILVDDKKVYNSRDDSSLGNSNNSAQLNNDKNSTFVSKRALKRPANFNDNVDNYREQNREQTAGDENYRSSHNRDTNWLDNNNCNFFNPLQNWSAFNSYNTAQDNRQQNQQQHQQQQQQPQNNNFSNEERNNWSRNQNQNDMNNRVQNWAVKQNESSIYNRESNCTDNNSALINAVLGRSSSIPYNMPQNNRQQTITETNWSISTNRNPERNFWQDNIYSTAAQNNNNSNQNNSNFTQNNNQAQVDKWNSYTASDKSSLGREINWQGSVRQTNTWSNNAYSSNRADSGWGNSSNNRGDSDWGNSNSNRGDSGYGNSSNNRIVSDWDNSNSNRGVSDWGSSNSNRGVSDWGSSNSNRGDSGYGNSSNNRGVSDWGSSSNNRASSGWGGSSNNRGGSGWGNSSYNRGDFGCGISGNNRGDSSWGNYFANLRNGNS